MSFLPYENVIYESNLIENDLRDRINQNIGPKRIFRTDLEKGDTKRYEGYLYEDKFKIKRTISYQNSFIPNIKGEIKQVNGISQIEVKMRMETVIYIFMLLFCGVMGLTVIAILISNIHDRSFEPAVIFPFGMLIFGYLLATGGFKLESTQSKKDLEKILNAKIKK